MTDFRIILIMSIIFPLMSSAQSDSSTLSVEVYDHLFELHRQMESAWESSDFSGIAAIYDDDGYLINSRGVTAQGTEEVVAYWNEINGVPLGWRLEEHYISPSLEDMINSDAWKALEKKPPLWEQFDVKLESGSTYYYDLGTSHLSMLREGEESTSVVTYLMVWEEKNDGSFRIQIDTYR